MISMSIKGKLRMMKFHSAKVLVFIVLCIIIFLPLISPQRANADQSKDHYDQQEAIRREVEKYKQYDQKMKEEAKERYDAANQPRVTPSGSDYLADYDPWVWSIAIIGAIIFVTFGAIKNKKDTQRRKAQTDEYFANKLIKEALAKELLLSNKLNKATSHGFSIDEETRECPSCAETIKLKATICKHCKREFSEEEKARALQAKIDSFLTSAS